MGAQGTVTINFGATPVSEASEVVTGVAGILLGSHVEVFLQEDSTGDNNAVAHKALAFLAKKPYADTIFAGTGFTAHITLPHGVASGTFKARWVWN